ncbi:MAG: FAD-binding domain-containing protein, partial [Rhodobacteraceae bacterium]|nr:FAD-binding domain-containing protein [Paracoccaceae bacterium]
AWGARRNGFVASAQVPVPAVEAASVLASDPWPEFDLVDPCPQRQKGGRPAAEAALRSFLEARGRSYRKAMSSPLAGAAACSRLSPHLALGTLSIREVVQATAARQRQIPKGARDGWAGSLRSFQARLAWRDHFMQKLEDAPEMECRAMHSAMQNVWSDVPDQERLERWQAGQTGVPFVDACMRSLRATGWLNFRMRAMVMSFASYQLWLDWRRTGRHLARMFSDYEPGIHWPQVQMQSGTTGMNTIRIYNPMKQGRDQDPTGAFTRRWLPELEAVPEAFLQVPWLWPGAAGLGYPGPVVEPEAAVRRARETLWGMRRSQAFREEAADVVKRHASRKQTRRRPPAKRADPRQTDFGF